MKGKFVLHLLGALWRFAPWPLSGRVGAHGLISGLVNRRSALRIGASAIWALSGEKRTWRGHLDSAIAHVTVMSVSARYIDFHQRRQLGLTLDGGDEALRTSAFPAFINMVHETQPLRLSASKAHLPIAFLANGLFGKRGRRRDRRFHHGPLTDLSGTVHEANRTHDPSTFGSG